MTTIENTTPAAATAETQVIEVKAVAPTAAAMGKNANAMLNMAQIFEITNDETFGLAAEELRDIKAKKDALTEQRLTITRPMDDAKKAVMALFATPVDLLTTAEGIFKTKMLAYSQEQERKAAEARLKAEQEAEAARQKLAEEAAELQAQGRAGEALVKETVAQMVVAAPVAMAAPVAKGISTKSTTDFEVEDLLKLVKHIAEHPDLIGLVAVDSVKLRAYVRGLGSNCNLPGVRVFSKQTIAARK